ncbi:MAG TPA: hypothetical protein ENN76_03220 [Euryarchaeota archaeon]|nr:hypothetical protein [Euryarchaeota archaeon]
MNILVVDMCYKKDSLSGYEFVRPIASIVGDFAFIVHRSEIDNTLLHRSDGMILCGTALQDDEYIRDEHLTKLVQRYEKPLLGICAGMQIFCLAHGSTIIEMEEIGMSEVNTVHDDLGIVSSAYHLHKKGVLPNDVFIALAKNQAGPQIVKLNNKTQYGVMFHPEVRNCHVVKKFLDIICQGR